jgi:crossover junction endodeoxyribonuclease RuvC
MRVLALDPGYDRLGVAIVERVDGNDILNYSCCVETDRTQSFPERLYVLGNALSSLIETHAPDVVAVETLFFNKNQKTAIAVAEVRGMILYLATTAKCAILEFGPQEVKVAVTGYGKSDKRAVFSMIKRLLPNAPVQALDDEYDAIALGLTALAHCRE